MKDQFHEKVMSQPTALAGFTKAYEGNPPWDIDKPQPPFVTVADQIVGPVLDSGCGTGGTSLYLAAKGLQVTGIDFVPEAIRRAWAKAHERGLNVEFLVKDAMTLNDWNRRFASVIDSGLFHVYSGQQRNQYVKGLAHILEPGGRLYLFCFNDNPSWPGGGISQHDLYDTFSKGWEIESLQLTDGELNKAFTAEHPDTFSKDMKMWFAVIRRK